MLSSTPKEAGMLLSSASKGNGMSCAERKTVAREWVDNCVDEGG